METKNNKVEILKLWVEEIAKQNQVENVKLTVVKNKVVLEWDQPQIELDFYELNNPKAPKAYEVIIKSAKFPDDPQIKITNKFFVLLRFIEQVLTPTFTGDAT